MPPAPQPPQRHRIPCHHYPRHPRATARLTPPILLLLLALAAAAAAAAAPDLSTTTPSGGDDDGPNNSNNNSNQAFPSPDFFAAPTTYQTKKTYTSLNKRTAINSTHLIPFNVTGGVFVDRDVRVANSTAVTLEPPPQVTAKFNFSDNTQFRLNDTDALDVGDDEALDVMSNGKGKALAGELDGLSTVFPDGSINKNAHGGEPMKPAALSAALAVRAGFNVSATVGTAVTFNDATDVEDSSDVTIAGLLLDVESVALNNTQVASEDSDFADTADNGGTTVLQAGSGVALAGEVEELPRDPHGNGSNRSRLSRRRGGPGAAFGPRGAETRRRQLGRGRLLLSSEVAPVDDATKTKTATSQPAQPQPQRQQPQQQQQLVRMLTMTVENNVTADGAVAVRGAQGVRSEPVDIHIDLVVDGATQANGTLAALKFGSGSSFFSSSSVVRRSSADGGDNTSSNTSSIFATAEAAPPPSSSSASSSSSSSSPPQPSSSYITLVLNIFNRVYVDARRLVTGSSDVTVGPQTIQVSVKVANVTQLDLGGRA